MYINDHHDHSKEYLAQKMRYNQAYLLQCRCNFQFEQGYVTFSLVVTWYFEYLYSESAGCMCRHKFVIVTAEACLYICTFVVFPISKCGYKIHISPNKQNIA